MTYCGESERKVFLTKLDRDRYVRRADTPLLLKNLSKSGD